MISCEGIGSSSNFAEAPAVIVEVGFRMTEVWGMGLSPRMSVLLVVDSRGVDQLLEVVEMLDWLKERWSLGSA